MGSKESCPPSHVGNGADHWQGQALEHSAVQDSGPRCPPHRGWNAWIFGPGVFSGSDPVLGLRTMAMAVASGLATPAQCLEGGHT